MCVVAARAWRREGGAGFLCEDEVEMKAAFVTGGGGYVGRLLVRELVKHGYSVTAFDLHFHETEKQQKGVTYILVS